MPTNHLIIILVTVFMSASAQVLLKIGADEISQKNAGIIYGDTFLSIVSVFLNPFVFIGMVVYILSAGAWIWVLSRVDISLAYPFVGLSFVITSAFGVLIFNESMDYAKVLGTALVMCGCVIIARS